MAFDTPSVSRRAQKYRPRRYVSQASKPGAARGPRARIAPARDLRPQDQGHLVGDLVVHREDVVLLGLEVLGPGRKAGAPGNELHRDAHTLALALHGPVQDRVRPERFRRLQGRHGLVREVRDRARRPHRHVLDAGEGADERVGDPEPQVILRVGADAAEGQHREDERGLGGGRAQGAAEAIAAARHRLHPGRVAGRGGRGRGAARSR